MGNTQPPSPSGPPPRPTDAELAILRVLWERGPSTVRAVWEEMGRGGRDVGYTTALKLLQIMADKGLVERDERGHSHIYRTKKSEAHTQRLLVRDLLDRAFGGSAEKLILRALDARRVPAEELAKIRTLLNQLEEGGDK